MSEPVRPLPFDPSRDNVQSFLTDLDGDWLYTSAGDYQTAAVEGFKRDGTNYQRLIALSWPVRHHGETEDTLLQLLIDPVDVVGLLANLSHTVAWLTAAERMGN